MFARVGLMFGKHRLTPLHQRTRLGVIGPSQGLYAQVKAAHLVANDPIEGCGCRPLIDEASHMEPFRLRPPVEDSVDRALVAVEGKHDRLGGGEELDKPGFLQAVHQLISAEH
jgi:hypothetical protein